MRRSICTCEPSFAKAGNLGNWRFRYITATALPKNSRMRFDLRSKGRFFDWEIPQLKKKDSAITVELDDGTSLVVTSSSTGVFEFVLPSEMKSGESVLITLKEVTCQKVAQRRRPFHLFIDPKGKADFKDPEIFHLDVHGNALKDLRIIAPSLVSRNKRFDVIVRFEDMYGNLTAQAPEDTIFELTYENLRENLRWKLFVPETGFIALPNLYFNEPGLYRLQMKNIKTNEVYFSPPIKCVADLSALSLFWGVLHGESDRVDSGNNIEAFLRHMRDEQALHFVATSCFDTEEETSSDIWKKVSQQVAEFNEEDRFVAILGFQWLGKPKQEGLRQLIYTRDNRAILRSQDTKYNTLQKIYKTHTPKDFLSIPSFTMGKETFYDFAEYQPEYERVAEIYNAWGSSECLEDLGNEAPIQGQPGGITEAGEGNLQKALNAGCRFGFVAGGYDDRGPFATCFPNEQVQYTPGLTAILAKEHTRTSLLEALSNRSCYATTGKRIVLQFFLANSPMGSELNAKSRPGLEYNRHLTGYAIGTDALKSAEIIRNGEVWISLDVKGNQLDFQVDDEDRLSQIAMESSQKDGATFIYYYLRVTQADGHVAWSSPIWVDTNGTTIKSKKK